MMETTGPHYGAESEREARRQLEGEERVALLPSADFLAVTAGSEPGDPVVVFIGWTPGLVEHAYPGTAIWCAAVRKFLRSPTTHNPGESVVRGTAAESLERFPTLDRWLSWYDHERQARSARRANRPKRQPTFWIGRLW
jgi:hypothetical protein